MGTGTGCFLPQTSVAVGADNNHRDWMLTLNTAGGLEPSTAGHVNIKDGQVRLVLKRQSLSLHAVPSLGDHLVPELG